MATKRDYKDAAWRGVRQGINDAKWMLPLAFFAMLAMWLVLLITAAAESK